MPPRRRARPLSLAEFHAVTPTRTQPSGIIRAASAPATASTAVERVEAALARAQPHAYTPPPRRPRRQDGHQLQEQTGEQQPAPAHSRNSSLGGGSELVSREAVVLRVFSHAEREGGGSERWRWRVGVELSDGGPTLMRGGGIPAHTLEWLVRAVRFEFGAVRDGGAELSSPSVRTAPPYEVTFVSGSMPDAMVSIEWKRALRKRPLAHELSVAEGTAERSVLVHFDAARLERLVALREEAEEDELQRAAEAHARHRREREAQHREAARQLPAGLELTRYREWSPDECATWVRSEGFGEYAAAFADEGVDGAMLSRLSDGALAEMGIGSELARLKLLRAIERIEDVQQGAAAANGSGVSGVAEAHSLNASNGAGGGIDGDGGHMGRVKSFEWGKNASGLRVRQNWEINMSEIDFGPDGPKRVGIGSYGEIFRGHWQGLPVACKVLLDQDLSDDLMDDFQHEVELCSSLRHPNIALWLGACTQPGRMAIVMELYPTSLSHYLHKSNLGKNASLSRVLAIAEGICRGMVYLHTPSAASARSGGDGSEDGKSEGERGEGGKLTPAVIHRDLNPKNVLLDSAGRPRITDFGLSRLKTASKMSTRGCAGTPQYTSPEVFKGIYTEKADSYSFGVTLWELVTRQMPFSAQGFGAMQIVAMCVSENHFARTHLMPLLPAETPTAVRGAIESCLAQDPHDRPDFDALLSIMVLAVKQAREAERS